MKYLVAVSGGIDSVVLLDMLMLESEHELIIAHFDHGIRPDSAADARFVEALAARYELPFVSRREDLGPGASESLARSRRYLFLGEEALIRGAKIATAHHQDDTIETIAINLTRGTGWRGLAVLDSDHITRPLLYYPKWEIRDYALRHRLEWVEDETNASDAYLRNRLRRQLQRRVSPEARKQLLMLWKEQCRLRREIEGESLLFMGPGEYSRHFLIQIEEEVAEELLRAYIEMCVDWSPTRPQLRRALLAIKTARPGTVFPLGGAWLRFTYRTFLISVKTP